MECHEPEKFGLLSILKILFVFNSAITYIHSISITCKFSLNKLSSSVVLSNWKRKPTLLCLDLYELFSEDIQTPSSPQITFHTIIFPPFFFVYLLCYLWTVYPNSTMSGAATLCPMQNTSPGNWWFPEIHMNFSLCFIWFYVYRGWQVGNFIEDHAKSCA